MKTCYFIRIFKSFIINMRKFYFLLLLTIGLFSCGNQHQFTKQQKKALTNADSNKPMRVFLITNKQDSILLRKKSSYINPKNKFTKVLANRLFATVRDSLSMGVGIAAPQIGVLKNIICVQRFDKKKFPFEFYLNPIIINCSDKKLPFPEGCLSIPNTKGITKNRAFTITIEYDTLDGEHKKENISDFTSVIFQHEIDHLNGILFIDHLKKDVITDHKKNTQKK